MSKASARHSKLGKNNRGFATKLADKKLKNREKNEKQYRNNLLKLEAVGDRETKTITKTITTAKGDIKQIKIEKLETPSGALRRIRRQALQPKGQS